VSPLGPPIAPVNITGGSLVYPHGFQSVGLQAVTMATHVPEWR